MTYRWSKKAAVPSFLSGYRMFLGTF